MNQGSWLETWRGTEERRGLLAQNYENSTRLGWALGGATTTGWGEFEIPERVDFDMNFIQEPHMHYGYSVDSDTLVATRFPRSWGFVARWDINADGHYVGFWPGIVVDTQSYALPTAEPEPGYTIKHYFTFIGTAMKDLPDIIANLDF